MSVAGDEATFTLASSISRTPNEIITCNALNGELEGDFKPLVTLWGLLWLGDGVVAIRNSW